MKTLPYGQAKDIEKQIDIVQASIKSLINIIESCSNEDMIKDVTRDLEREEKNLQRFKTLYPEFFI